MNLRVEALLVRTGCFGGFWICCLSLLRPCALLGSFAVLVVVLGSLVCRYPLLPGRPTQVGLLGLLVPRGARKQRPTSRQSSADTKIENPSVFVVRLLSLGFVLPQMVGQRIVLGS